MSTKTAFISFKSISMSRVGFRKPQTLALAAAHNLREVDLAMYEDDRFDPSRSVHNIVLEGPRRSREVEELAVQQAQRLIEQPGRLRRDHCQAIECVVSLSSGCDFDPPDYFRDTLGWLVDALGMPVLSAIVHNDQRNPHMHVLLNPIQSGVRVGSAPITRPRLKSLTRSFRDEVASRYGLSMYGIEPPKSIAARVERLAWQLLEERRPGLETDDRIMAIAKMTAHKSPGYVLAKLDPQVERLQDLIQASGRHSVMLRDYLIELFPVYRVQLSVQGQASASCSS